MKSPEDFEGSRRPVTPEELEECGFKIGDDVEYTHPTSGEFDDFETGVPEGVNPYIGKVVDIYYDRSSRVNVDVTFPKVSVSFYWNTLPYLKKVE